MPWPSGFTGHIMPVRCALYCFVIAYCSYTIYIWYNMKICLYTLFANEAFIHTLLAVSFRLRYLRIHYIYARMNEMEIFYINDESYIICKCIIHQICIKRYGV